MADGVVIFDVELNSDGISSALSGVGSKIARSAAVVAAGAAIGKELSAAIGTGMEFEGIMSKVEALSGATSAQMAELTEAAKQWGADTAFSASEVGQAFTYMAQAGWNTSQMLAGIGPVLNLAAADGLDLATTSDIVTDSLTAFGLKAADTAMYADVLATAAAASNTNVAMMGETFKYAAPVAGALGYSVQDVALAVGLMANAGIKGSQAGTSLRGILTRMVKPTKQSAEALDDLGLSLSNVDGTMKPFGQVLDELRTTFAGLTAEEQANYAALLAGQEGMSGLLAIVNASDTDFNNLADAINNSSGAAERMAETMLDNLAGDVEQFKGAAETLALEFYGTFSDKLRTAVQTGTGIIDKLTEGVKEGDLAGAFESILTTDLPAIASDIGTGLGKALSNLPEMADAAKQIVSALAVGIAKSIPGIANGIWTGLTQGLREKTVGVEVVAKIDEATKTLDTLDADIKALKEKYVTDAIQINLDAKNAESLIAELAELQGKEVLTEAEASRMQTISQSLVNIYSQLGSYMGDTGVLTLEADAVSNLVTQYQALAREKAAANYLSGVAGEYASAELAHKELELQLSSLLERNKAYEEQIGIFNQLADSAVKYASVFQNMFTGGGDAVDLATVEQALNLLQQYGEVAGTLDGLSLQGIDLSLLFGADGETLDASAVQANVDALVELQSALFIISSLSGDARSAATLDMGGLTQEIEAVSKALETHSETLTQAAAKYEEALTLVNEYLGEGATEAGEAAQQGAAAVEEGITAVGEALSGGEIESSEQSALAEQAQAVMEETKTAVQEGKTAIEEELSGLAATLTEAINTALTAESADGSTSAEDKLVLMGSAMAEAVALGIQTGAPSVTSALMALFAPPAEGTAEAMATNAAEWVEALKTAISTAVSGGESAAAGAAGEAGEGGEDGGMLALGLSLAQSVAKGIKNGAPDIKSALDKAISDAKKHIETTYLPQFKTLGEQISQGIADGIAAGSGAISDALVSAVLNAIGAAKTALGIASPSKVARDVIGRWIPSGAAEGVKLESWQLRNAVRSMALESMSGMSALSRRAASNIHFGWADARLAKKAAMAAYGQPIQEVNFNVPVQTPDEFAETVELFMTYGLEADY